MGIPLSQWGIILLISGKTVKVEYTFGYKQRDLICLLIFTTHPSLSAHSLALI